jgi:hypothetical protein
VQVAVARAVIAELFITAVFGRSYVLRLMMNLAKGRDWIGKDGGVLYDTDASGVCTITLNRPEALNAMNEGVMSGESTAAQDISFCVL